MMNARRLRRLQRILEWGVYFTRFFFRQFYRQRGLQIASSLAYATLLALVPLVSVVSGFLGGLPWFSRLGETVQAWLFSNFVPAFGETVLEYVSGFSSKASQLTIPGIAVIFLIALTLMATIDNAINSIWHVRVRRNPLARFLVYWAILTLGPLLVGAGLITTSYLLSLPVLHGSEMGAGFEREVLQWLPVLSSAAAFSILYLLIPNCHVVRWHAVTGGMVAAGLFELAKYGFGIYVRAMPGFQTLYGALAVIPVFLIWIYTSWVVVLLGAHITFCLSAFRLSAEKTGRRDHEWSFEEVYDVIHELWRAQQQGQALAVQAMHRKGLRIPAYQLNEILELLEAAAWVHRTVNGHWALSRDLDQVSVLDLVRIIPRPLPLDTAGHGVDTRGAGYTQLLATYRASVAQGLEIPVSRVMEAADVSPAPSD